MTRTTMWQILFAAALAVELVLLILCIAAYRIKRTASSCCFMLASICYLVARNSPFIFGMVSEFRFPDHSATAAERETLHWSQYYTDKSFQLLFLILMCVGLYRLCRESTAKLSPSA